MYLYRDCICHACTWTPKREGAQPSPVTAKFSWESGLSLWFTSVPLVACPESLSSPKCLTAAQGWVKKKYRLWDQKCLGLNPTHQVCHLG